MDEAAGSSAPVSSARAHEPNSWRARALAVAMAAHPRIGGCCPLSLQRVAHDQDLMQAIMRHMQIVVPDDVPTLASAVRMAMAGQKILLRQGEHLVSSRSRDDPGSSRLEIDRGVVLVGEAGSLIRGTLVVGGDGGGGSISGLVLEDGGDCCVRCLGGRWHLERLEMRCSHSASLHVCAGAEVDAYECVLGGEGGEEAGKRVVMLSAYGALQEHVRAEGGSNLGVQGGGKARPALVGRGSTGRGPIPPFAFGPMPGPIQARVLRRRGVWLRHGWPRPLQDPKRLGSGGYTPFA